MAPPQRSYFQTIEIHMKIYKNLLQNLLAQMLEIWYVELPDGPLPSLFKQKSLGPRRPCTRSSYVQTVEIHKPYSKVVFRATMLSSGPPITR